MLRGVIFFFILLIHQELFAQRLPYVKEVVRILTSDSLAGRGYVENGDKKAAAFIASEFSRLGLDPLSEQYLQSFITPVNTFPGKVLVVVDGDTLSPGKDYLVEFGSPPVSGIFRPLWVTDKELSTGLTQNMLQADILILSNENDPDLSSEADDRVQQIKRFLRYQGDERYPIPFFVTDKKLSWSGYPARLPGASVTISDSLLNTAVEKIELVIESVYEPKYQTQNVIGYLPGQRSDSMIVLTAHYDHFGKMGTALFPGANDNASGVSLMLGLAKEFSEELPPFDMVFIAFGAEEIGLIGSKYFVEHPLIDLGKIRFLVNLDISGTGDDGIQVVNGTAFSSEFKRLQDLNASAGLMKQVKTRGPACNSDHCPFFERGVPSFYIYTLGGSRAYHDVFDTYDNLSFSDTEDYMELLIRFLESF